MLIGVPNAVIFQKGRPTYVVELKTTRGNASVLYNGQRAQTVIYGLLLDQVGFDCGNLELAVIKLGGRPRCRASRKAGSSTR